MTGGPPRGMMGPNEKAREKLKEPKPQSLKEVPGYIWRVISKFCYRLLYIYGIVWDTRPWILFFMMFMAIFNGVSPVISAYINMLLINELAAAYINAVNGIATAFTGIMGLLIFRFAFSFFTGMMQRVNNIVSSIAGELVVNNVNLRLMHKAKTVDLASFDRPEFYEKLENAKREAGHRPLQILNSNFTIVSTIISMVSFIVVLVAISPAAPWIIALLAVPTAVINFVYRRKNFFYIRHHSKERRQMNYYSDLITNKDMVKEVRLFGLSELFIARYNETFGKYFAGLKKLFIGEGIWHMISSVLTTAVNCALFILIAKGVYEGNYEVGNYTYYTNALTSIAGGIGTLIGTTASIYEGTLFIDNLIAFMKEEPTVIPTLAEPAKLQHHTGHQIRLENVSFRYPGTERDVIKNVNLTIEPGDTVVLVGLNGAGKTTLIKLLTRLYDPTEGCIYLDGRDIREYDVADLYSLYGIIFQDFGKYAVNVTENIKFGQLSRDAGMEEIQYAAKQSSADAFINDLPDGYDTPLMRYFEENGIELSIGQWQKLSIARAFYSDSDIVILDEPTASLDAIAEQEIYNQFDSLRADKTTIFVSHRLSSATVANKIVVLEHGQVIEIGNHAELMQKRGVYWNLFSTQAKRYITSENEGVIADEDATLPPPSFGQNPPEGFGPLHGHRPHDGHRPPDGFGPRGGHKPPEGFGPGEGHKPPDKPTNNG
ncbi:MAG: ATP-binding cassette domain-containing protein [Ruminococcaceae bacterium]|nr:ATP-binding cassette domain-containing protein [Oscillospiraceae bacterium]